MDLKAKLQCKYSSLQPQPKDPRFWFEVYTKGQSAAELRSISDLLAMTNDPLQMLVYGKPKFGKTLMCNALCFMWAMHCENPTHEDQVKCQECSNIQRYEICCMFTLNNENVENLEDNIICACYEVLDDANASKDELKEAWAEKINSTVLVLDGYDNLDKENRLIVKTFIENSEYFLLSSKIVTCRPDVDREFSNMFSTQADICGLSDEVLDKIAKVSHRSDQLSSFVTSCKVRELYEMSPQFFEILANICMQSELPESLYDLLDQIIKECFKSVLGDETTDENIEECLCELGKGMFQCLKRGRLTFKEEQIVKCLSIKRELLQKLNIFIECCSSGENIKLVTSHRIFMGYFCAKYLQTEWIKLTERKSQDDFLNDNFGFSDCSYDVLIDSNNPSKCYCVGQIIDVIFQYERSDEALLSGKFRMIQDVSCPKLCNAFNYCSLLLRMDFSKLPLFGIKKYDDGDDDDYDILQETFALLVQMFNFPHFIVDNKFFKVGDSSTQLMKFNVVEDDNKTVLFGCASAFSDFSSKLPGNIREIVLDFKDANLKELSPFLRLFTETFLSAGHMQEAYTEGQGSELIYDLVLSALDCTEDYHIQLTLGANAIHSKNLVTWEIISSASCAPKANFRYFKDCEQKTRNYNNEECRIICDGKDKAKFIDIMKLCPFTENERYVTVCLKSVAACV